VRVDITYRHAADWAECGPDALCHLAQRGALKPRFHDARSRLTVVHLKCHLEAYSNFFERRRSVCRRLNQVLACIKGTDM